MGALIRLSFSGSSVLGCNLLCIMLNSRLANGSLSPPSLVFKGLQSGWRLPRWAERLSFGSYCAPICAPVSRSSHVFQRFISGPLGIASIYAQYHLLSPYVQEIRT